MPIGIAGVVLVDARGVGALPFPGPVLRRSCPASASPTLAPAASPALGVLDGRPRLVGVAAPAAAARGVAAPSAKDALLAGPSSTTRTGVFVATLRCGLPRGVVDAARTPSAAAVADPLVRRGEAVSLRTTLVPERVCSAPVGITARTMMSAAAAKEIHARRRAMHAIAPAALVS